MYANSPPTMTHRTAGWLDHGGGSGRRRGNFRWPLKLELLVAIQRLDGDGVGA